MARRSDTLAAVIAANTAARTKRQKIFQTIDAERERQLMKGFDLQSDCERNSLDWHEMIADYNAWVRRMTTMGDWVRARRRYLQVAALAVAAVEALDATVTYD